MRILLEMYRSARRQEQRRQEKGPFYIDFAEVDKDSNKRLLIWQLAKLADYAEIHYGGRL